MSDKTNTISDENLQIRPRGLSMTDADRKDNSAVAGLLKNNPRNSNEKDGNTKHEAQHMKKMKRNILLFAGVNSAVNHHNTKVYEKTVKNKEKWEKVISEQKNKPGASGVQARSVTEIFAEMTLKEEQKKLEKLQKKHPNLQRPQSFGERVNKAGKTISQGVKEAIRAKNMQNVVQMQSGSDARALAAVAASGYVPGTAVSSQSDDYSL